MTHYQISNPHSSEEIVVSPHMPVFSNKPDLHKFWSGVVAGAGILPDVRSVARPVLVSGPSDDISSLRSVRVSFEEDQETNPSAAGRHKGIQIPRKPVSRKCATTSDSHHSSLFSIRRQNHAGCDERSSTWRESNPRNLDGSSDLISLGTRPSLVSIATITHSDSTEGSSFEDEVRGAHEMASAALPIRMRDEQISPSVPTTTPPENTIDLPSSVYPNYPQQSHGLPNLPRRASGHPRSPLYISQIATSSSPDNRRQSIPSTSESDVLGQIEMLSIGHPATEPARAKSRHNPFPLSHTRRPSQKRYFSPFDPTLSVPPHPFSAVRRAVSFTPSLPSASPSSSLSSSSTPLNSPFHSYSNITYSGPSLTPPPTQTPNYTIYNDRLPASSQPRTPVGLSTNGLPRNGLPSVQVGAFTAPTLNRNATWQRSSDTHIPGSPIRARVRVPGMRLDDQENARHDSEIERRWRRQASLAGSRLSLESDDSE